jgi:hypothetical protein
VVESEWLSEDRHRDLQSQRGDGAAHTDVLLTDLCNSREVVQQHFGPAIKFSELFMDSDN